MTDEDLTRDPRLQAVAEVQPYPLLFLTISGAHLYGFPSPDSDFDVRGVHVLPVEEVVGIRAGRETIESGGHREGLVLDLVTHDLLKFCQLLLKKNGLVLENLHAPLVVRTSAAHEELQAIARRCVTRHHAYHYLGFARSQWELFEKQRRVKPLLYVYRVLLTGIHMVRTGEIESSLVRLNEVYELPYVPELIAAKREGGEEAAFGDGDLSFHEREYGRLRQMLEDAHATSTLPEAPLGKAALHDLLVRVRLGRD